MARISPTTLAAKRVGRDSRRLRPRPPCGGGKGWGVVPTMERVAFRASREWAEGQGATPLPASPARGEETSRSPSLTLAGG